MKSQQDSNLDTPQIPILEFLFKDHPPKVIFDIGACEAEDSLRYHNMFPQCQIFAVEPLPKNIKRIKHLIADEQTTRLHLAEYAIGSEDGRQIFYVSFGRPDSAGKEEWDYGNKSSSLLKPTSLMSKFHSWLQFNETITVDVLTLPSLVKKYNVTTIDFIHLDVQGAELKILKTGRSVLQNVRAVWLEVADHAIYSSQPTARDVEKYMGSVGFVKLVDSRVDGFGDQFYVQPSLFEVREVR